MEIAVIYSSENLIKLETKPTNQPNKKTNKKKQKYDYLRQNFECIIKHAFVGFLLVLSFPPLFKNIYIRQCP